MPIAECEDVFNVFEKEVLIAKAQRTECVMHIIGKDKRCLERTCSPMKNHQREVCTHAESSTTGMSVTPLASLTARVMKSSPFVFTSLDLCEA